MPFPQVLLLSIKHAFTPHFLTTLIHHKTIQKSKFNLASSAKDRLENRMSKNGSAWAFKRRRSEGVGRVSFSHEGAGIFLCVSLNPATNPRLLATTLMSPLISCCKLNSGFPAFSSEAGEKMGGILLHSREILTPLFLQRASERQNGFHPSKARKRIKVGVCWCLRKHRVCSFAACALSVYFSSPNIKGEISPSNILQHFNELLSLTWWQGGNNNPLYLHTTKMSHSQPALLDSAAFEPRWTEIS